nr:ShlB/FhaC/HecB family hemolysin secretion/activation protein [Sandaracinobacteroides sayramensis]
MVLAAAATPAIAQDAPQGAAEAAPAARFEIRAFQVTGNTLLPPDTVERTVYPHMGPDRSEADVEGARAALQKAFEDAGYVAVAVVIPEQSVGSGIIRLDVQPQTVGQLLVEGSKDAEAVKALAPSVAPGETPNLPAFQRDVVALNSKASRKVTPELRAGTAPGTLDVVLKVEESSPFHASAELNNFSSSATTDLRASATIRYDDMWGRGDSLSLSAQTAPRRTDDGTVFSGNYLMRLGSGTQMLLYGVHSDSDIAVVGGTSVIGKGNMAGFRLIQSLGSSEGFYHALTLGMDWKDFKEDVVLIGADRASAPIEYFPITASWRGDWSGDRAKSNIAFSTTLGIRGLGDDWFRFNEKRYMARQSFIALKLDAEHEQEIGSDIQVNARLSSQWSPDPLISNEGFSLGGMSTVRGYYESEVIGDYGVALQTEIRTPDLAKILGGNLLNELRFHAFLDGGWSGIHYPLESQIADRNQYLVSTGIGGRVRLFKYFTGAFDLGLPLNSGPETGSGDVFFRFRIQGEF